MIVDLGGSLLQRNAHKIVIHSSKEECDTGESKDPMCVYIPCFVMPFFRRFTTSSEISITPAEDGFGLSIETERGSDECAAPMFLTRFYIAAIVYSTNRKVQNLIEIVKIYLQQNIRNKPGAQQSLSSTKKYYPESQTCVCHNNCIIDFDSLPIRSITGCFM